MGISFFFLVLLQSLIFLCVNSLERILPGHTVFESYHSPLPHTYVLPGDLPKAFSWGNVDGVSYLTKSLNQHIPQYCGSCWAHSAVSSLSDRIMIARGTTAGQGEINLSVQFLLNCGSEIAGSCHGGSATGAFEFIQKKGFIPYDTCQPYLACSSDSEEGICPHVNTSCSAMNICRTCMPSTGCVALSRFPNATVAEYGVYQNDAFAIMAEIWMRGPVKASVDATHLVNYTGGIIWDEPKYRSDHHNHGVSIVGWGYDEDKEDRKYWIVRNSWGQYWGELGFFRVEAGKNLLMIESNVAWATPGTFSTSNVPCPVGGGGDCGGDVEQQQQQQQQHYQEYIDPSNDAEAVQRRLRGKV